MLSHSKRLNKEQNIRLIIFQKVIVLTFTAARNQNLTHTTEPVWRLRYETSAYSLFYPKEEDSNWRRNARNHVPNQTVSHLRRSSPQGAFCFALVN